MPKLAMQFFKRASSVLEKENVTFDKAVVAELINKHIPDWRRVLNELQRYSATGSIDSGIFVNLSNDSFKFLVDLVKSKNFNEMRRWVAESADSDYSSVFRKFYDQAYAYLKPQSIPHLVLLIGKYQYQSAFVADQEVNLAAFLTEVIIELEFLP